MRVGIATDHGGFNLKEELVKQLNEAGHEAYRIRAQRPNNQRRLSSRLCRPRGSGSCPEKTAAWRFAEAVWALCARTKFGWRLVPRQFITVSPARQGVEDDHMNILCMGGRTVGPAVAWDLVPDASSWPISAVLRVHLYLLRQTASLEAQREAKRRRKNYDRLRI